MGVSALCSVAVDTGATAISGGHSDVDCEAVYESFSCTSRPASVSAAYSHR